jgi:hypothetical protein
MRDQAQLSSHSCVYHYALNGKHVSSSEHQIRHGLGITLVFLSSLQQRKSTCTKAIIAVGATAMQANNTSIQQSQALKNACWICLKWNVMAAKGLFEDIRSPA